MKDFYFLLLFAFLFTSCSNSSALEINTDTTSNKKNISILLPDSKPTISYDSLLKEIENKRIELNQRYINSTNQVEKTQILEEARQVLITSITEKVFPYWYGTPWDFNGYTNVPGKGLIACGYFVSTTLKHAGMNLNRYKLAQQAALNITKSVNGNEGIHILSSMNELQAHLLNQKDGLFVLGLDNHVGYVYKKDSSLIFIHSTYLPPTCVIQEFLEKSEAANLSRSFTIARAFPDAIIEKWLKRESVKIYY